MTTIDNSRATWFAALPGARRGAGLHRRRIKPAITFSSIRPARQQRAHARRGHGVWCLPPMGQGTQYRQQLHDRFGDQPTQPSNRHRISLPRARRSAFAMSAIRSWRRRPNGRCASATAAGPVYRHTTGETSSETRLTARRCRSSPPTSARPHRDHSRPHRDHPRLRARGGFTLALTIGLVVWSFSCSCAALGDVHSRRHVPLACWARAPRCICSPQPRQPVVDGAHDRGRP